MARTLVLAFLALAVAQLLAMATVVQQAEAAPISARHAANDNKQRPPPPAADGSMGAFKAIAKSISDKIKHIIILMEENRSFDHMFGFYGKGTNGLTGKEYNLVNTSDPNSKKIYVDDKAPYINQCDPVHGLSGTTAKIFGSLARGAACNYTCEDMGGFAQYEAPNAANNYCNVMESLDNREKLPVLTSLADNYVLMDRFFCSIPGPTWPNRLFHLAATSGGDTSTGPFYRNVPGQLYPHKTIFDQVAEVGGEWKLYYNDTPWEMMLASLAHHPENMAPMDTFFADCQNGNLPDYAFINPRAGINVTSGIGANDQHPDHDIRAGEQFYKDIYEALRASPQWEETLFIITYDEHGGFYDHVAPPINVPVPDDATSYPDPAFTFDRLGIRIPTLLISPWVPKGLVVGRAPEAQRPQPNSEYDLTSIMASARKILKKLEGVPALTKRDAWASTFEHVLDMVSEPRTDCPMHLPDPEAPSKWDLAAEARQPVNDLQAEIMQTHHVLANPDAESPKHPHHIQQQSQIGDFLQSSYAVHKERTLRWKASKGRVGRDVLEREGLGHLDIKNHATSYTMRITPDPIPVFNKDWRINSSAAVPYVTVHGKSKPNTELCFDVAEYKVGSPLLMTLCYPSNAPAKNRDEFQWWVVGNDATIRPYKAQHLCVSNDFFQVADMSKATVFLDACNASDVRQHYAYHGKAPGDGGSGVFYFGDGSTVISAVAN